VAMHVCVQWSVRRCWCQHRALIAFYTGFAVGRANIVEKAMRRTSAPAALVLVGASYLVALCVIQSKATVLEESTTSAAATDWKPEGNVPTVPFFNEW